jgi:hypothetical protein
MERNKQLKIIQAINTELNVLEKERNAYLNILYLHLPYEDISGDTEEFILESLRKINEDIVCLEGIQEEVLNGYKDNS